MKKTNIVISILFHAALIGVALRFAVSHEKIQDIEPISFEIIEMKESALNQENFALTQNAAPPKNIPEPGKNIPETLPQYPAENTEPTLEKTPALLHKKRDAVIPLPMPPEENTVPETTAQSPVRPVAIPEKQIEEKPEEKKVPIQKNPKEDRVAEASLSSVPTVSAKPDIPPRAKNRITPSYPRSARRRNREGCVSVKAHIAEDGTVTKTEVVASSGYDDLDLAATKAINTAAFVPAEKNGRPASGELLLVFEFKLK